MGASGFFSDELKQAVRRVVAEVERQSSAEVVVVVQPTSGSYRHIDLALGSATAFVILCVFLYHPYPFDFTYLPLELAAGFFAGTLLSLGAPPLRRLLTSRRTRQAHAEMAARAAFVEHGLHTTSGRTGVLVFVSWFERRALLVPDVGVPVAELGEPWQRLSERLDSAVRGNDREAFISALGEFGPLLAGPLPRLVHDENELEDEVRETQ